jgi:SagB-type dehydrogenase family enzyme
MSAPYFLVLKSGAALDGVPAMLADALVRGATEDQLCETASDLPRLFYLLEELRRANLLDYELRRDGETMARIVPLDGVFQFQPVEMCHGVRYVLSRFAYLRREGDEFVLESPRVPARVVLRNADLAGAIAGDLAGPLLQAGFLEEAGATEPAALATWEFHDLLFHTRSRMGRAPGSIGGTYRFEGRFPPLAALKPPMSGERIALYRPDLEKLAREDSPFTRVLEARRSLRDASARALTCGQLGEFLYRTAHIQEIRDARPQQLLQRPYPAGGAIHELEFYVAVHACEGLAAGLYHYHAGEHAFYRLAATEAQLRQLLDLEPVPHALIILAARFGRIMWKYEGMAYRLILLDAGVAMQTMYLVATAMNLAPCALGNGDPALFAAAAGLDPLEETSVGEFTLCGQAV